MPTYEYECNKCGHHFEKFQQMSDKPVKECPACKGKVHRLISAGGGVIFKSSGFNITEQMEAFDSQTRCGKDQTCCGRDDPCEKPPCRE